MKGAWTGGLTAVVLTLLGCEGKKAVIQVPPPLVLTTTLESESTEVIHLRGSVAPDQRLKLGFRKGGVLASVRVREGEPVRAGQVLATLEDAEWKAGVVAARAALAKAQRDLGRAQRLVAEGALPASVAEDAGTAVAAAEAERVAAEEGLAKLRLMAPVSGTIFQRLAEPGEAVGDGQPVVILDSTGALVVRAGVTEAQARSLRGVGEVLLRTETGLEGSGQVRSLGASPSPEDGLFVLEVVPKGMKALKPGSLVWLDIRGLNPQPGMSVPVEALVHRQDATYICVVEGAGAEARISHRPVTVLSLQGRTARIQGELQPGLRVVSEGGAFLQNGQPARVKE